MIKKNEIIFQCRNLYSRLKSIMPEILAHIESLSNGDFTFHKPSRKWGYKISSELGTRDSEFVTFCIHERANHIRFTFYGKPHEFESDGVLPISGDRPSYSFCNLDRDSQKDALIRYLTKSYELWHARVNHHGLI